MIPYFKCTMLGLLLVVAAPAAAHAQFGGLKKKLKEKVGLEETTSSKASTQWKEGERIEPLTSEGLERFIAKWKSARKFDALADTEREGFVQQNAALREQQETCKQSALSGPDMMELGQRMQRRMMELTQAGDPNAAAKAGAEQQAAMLKLTGKCGPEVEDVLAPFSWDENKLREWLCAYVAVRAEFGAHKAAAVVLATDREVTMMEAHLDTFQRLCSDENGPAKVRR